MRKQRFTRVISGLFLMAIVWLAGTGTVQGQFTQNRDKIKINPSSFPADIQKGYRLFQGKCSECHGLDTSLKPSMSPAQWTVEVKRMKAMASAQFNDEQAKAILEFLNYDESHRKAETKQAATSSAPASETLVSDTVAVGRQFYFAQGCDTCHAIAGKGGTAGPSLTDVGARLSRSQLMEILHAIHGTNNVATSMPPLPPGTTYEEVNDLGDFLMTLQGK